MPDWASCEKKQLTERWGPRDETWQREAINAMDRAIEFVGGRPDGGRSKSSLLNYFKDLVWLRNRTKGHGAILGGVCAQVAPELEQSLRLISDYYEGFSGKWLFLRRNLSGKYRLVPIHGDTSSFEYLKTEEDHHFETGIYRGGPAALHKVPLFFTDPDLSDFYFANGNYRSERFQILSYHTDSTRDVDSDEFSLPASSLPLSGTTAGPKLDVLRETFANLPPQIPDYVSRPELETAIKDLIVNDRHRIVTLAGRGGVGKTSTALEVLDAVAQDQRYFAILWFSARDIDLLAHGPKSVQPDVLTEREVAVRFVELMNPAGSAAKDFDEIRYFRQCLDGRNLDGPLLFVFDNFETVRNSSDLYNSLDAHIRLPNKILITSRSRNFKGDYPVDVRGMNRSEFAVLAEETARRLEISELLTNDFMDKLFEESEGHPYVVRILLGEVAESGGQRTVERVMAERDDILDALFERTYASLSPAAQRIFLTLASWRSIVPRLAVEATLLRPENERMDVGRAIASLERNSLVEVLDGPNEAEQFLRIPVAAGVFGRKKLVVSSWKSAIEADVEIVMMFGATQPDESKKGIGPRVDRMVQTLAKRASRSDSIEDGLRVLNYVARQYPPAWLKIASLEEEIGLPVQAAESTRKFLENFPESREAWGRLASLCEKGNDPLGQVTALCELAQAVGSSLEDSSNAANIFNFLMAKNRLDLRGDGKKALAERIRLLLERQSDKMGATDFSRLAWICIHLGDESAARKYVLSGLKIDETNEHCVRLDEHLRSI